MQEHAPRPKIADAPLSVILLAAGPASAVADSVSSWRAYLATLDHPCELILLHFGAAEPDANAVLADVRTITHDPSAGYGAALQAAIESAQHPLVALCPADRQFDATELGHLFGVIDHVDLAIGCRRVPPRPLGLRLLGRALAWTGRILVGLSSEPSPCPVGATPWRRRWLARWAFGVRLHDPESPFRLARREAIARIVLQSRGRFALVEQLAKANHLELILAEEPVAWSPPATAAPDDPSFAEDARAVFRRPDFGPPGRHVCATARPAEKLPEAPTKPPSVSS